MLWTLFCPEFIVMSLRKQSKRFGFSDNGWCNESSDCRIIKSPNFDARPKGTKIDLLVLHNISLPLGKFGGKEIENLFLNQLDTSKKIFKPLRNLEVSCHFLIKRTGSLIQFVSLLDRAWHAGESSFLGRVRCNDYSIGIEIEGTDFEKFNDEQYVTLDNLIVSIGNFLPSLSSIASHSFIAPDRKTDPGPYFDWNRVRETVETTKKNIFLFP